MNRLLHSDEQTLPVPPLERTMTADKRFAWIWLVARVYLGWLWLVDGWTRLQNPSWMDGPTGLRAIWAPLLADQGDGRHDWYRSILRFLMETEGSHLLAKVVAIAETVLGIALILGLLVGLSALVGTLVNVNVMMAATGVVNPLTLGLAFLLVLGWKTAGWIGFDRWLLPLLGAPWESGAIWGRRMPGMAKSPITLEVSE